MRKVEASWPYHASLLFYRDLSGRVNLTSITSEKEHAPKAVYRGESTDVVVAVRPEFAEPARPPYYHVVCP